MKLVKKTLSVFMVILTLFTMCSVVMPVIAVEDSLLITDDELLTDTENELSTEGSSEAEIVSEIVEKRDETTKQFLLSDGSFKIAQYNFPVHYQDEDGEWIDIDNTLSKVEATEEQIELFGTEDIYSTNKLIDNIVFAEKSNSNTLVSFEAEDFPISLNYQSAKKSYIKIVEESNGYEGDDAFLMLSNVKQEVLYENVFDDVDLQYIVSPSVIKENIILKSKNADNTFTVNYNIGDLTAEVVDEHTINLMSGDNLIYTISAPYMYDANGEMSYDVTMTVDKNKNGKLCVDITADSDWLQAEGRVYPVTVDPSIETEKKRSAINTSMIANNSAYQNRNWFNYGETIVGGEQTYGICRVLTEIELPNLDKGDILVSAVFNVYNFDLYYSAGYESNMQVNVHKITESWDYSTVTWANSPSFESVVADYEIFEQGSGWRTFDITSIAKYWYENKNENENKNFGVLLKSAVEDESTIRYGHKAKLYMERVNTTQASYPYITLTYRNNRGLEDYWTYTTVSAGTAGTAYINDYTGNLVFVHGDVATTGMLMPVSLEHVYNGYRAYSNASMHPHSGKGYKLSLQQKVVANTNSAYYPYYYEDGDGTIHYFYKETADGVTRYFDEDGLNLELKVLANNGGYTITDKSDNVMSFDASGYLKSIEDADGKKATLSYLTLDNYKGNPYKYLNKITDGAGHEITLTYNYGENNSSQISKITRPDGKSITYLTSDGFLKRIIYPDETYCIYDYDEDGSMISAISSDGYKLSFSYTDIGKGKRVATVTESNGSTIGQKITFDRTKLNQTVIRTPGKDAVSGNSDDIRTIYQFDNFGRTISTKSYLANGTNLGAQNYTYTSDSSDNKMRNRIATAAATGKYVNNLLPNHNFENATIWGKTGVYKTINDTAIADAQFVSGTSYMGSGSAKVEYKNCTQKSGYGMYRNTTAILTPGSTYTLSAYVKIDELTQAVSGIEGGACLAMRFTHEDESSEYVFSRMVKSTNGSIDGGWQRVFMTFTVPEDAIDSKAFLLMYCATGVAYFDCVQLEKNNTANSYNIIQNSSFENGATGWNPVHTTSSDAVSTSAHNSGSSSYKITGVTETQKHIRQDIPVTGSEDDTYILSGYAKANSVPFDQSSSGHVFELAVRIRYEDGDEIVKTPAKFNHAVTDWQYASGVFNLSDGDSNTNRKPESIKVYCVYYNQVNNAYFDDISLIKEPAPTYTYDSEGNLISATENAQSKTAMGYDSNDNLTSFKNEKNAQYTYTYATSGNKHQLKTAVDNTTNIRYEYSYYGNGNFKAQEIKNQSGSVVIRNSASYTAAADGIAAGAYTLKESDQHGYVTAYDYNLQSGVLNSVTDSLGNKTSYTYNADNGLLTNVASGTKSVSYDYNTPQTALTKITHNGFDYTFAYDGFGNVLNTKVAGTTLMTNTYQSNNGTLQKSTYGNGDYREYSYDSVGRTTLIKRNGSNSYYWRYNANGNVGLHTDYVNDRVYYYTYDSLGRVVEELEKTYGEDEYRFESDYVYDVSNNLKKVVNRADGIVVSTAYTYDSINRPTKTTINSSVNYTYAYDTLGRFSQFYLNGTNKNVLVDYDYYNAKSRTSTDTVTYKTSQIAREKIEDRGYYYTYDRLGNIIQIDEKTADSSTYNVKATYTYDQWGQLKTEINVDLGQKIVYTYDTGGNITSKKIYAYTNGTVGSLIDTINYTYNSTWKDKLASYDGQTITYDSIGNPKTYRDGMSFIWNGRQMKTANLNGTSVTYKYNADGQRTYKKVGSTVHEYEYSNGRLYYEKRGDIQFYYRYDAMGNLAAFSRVKADGSKYVLYAICNSRGDVEELRNESGTLFARYVYDSWGNVIHIYNANGNEITSSTNMAVQNPIRYRGYYFDAESGLYYLQSRYYDPVTCRFVNADSLVDTSDILGHNIYAYCGNNPVNYSDPTGHSLVGALLGSTFAKKAAETIFGLVFIVAFAYASNKALGDIAQIVCDAVDNASTKINTRDQSVYTLKDSNDKVRYIGRTNDPKRRSYEHKHDDKHPERQYYEMNVVATGMNLPEAKLTEQVLISAYTLDYLDNARREISVGNLAGFKDNMGAVIQLFESIPEDELMNLMRR